MEHRPGEARVAPDGGLYHRHRPRRPGHCSGRNLMPATISDAAFARCPLFRGMTADERQELVGLLDGKVYPAGSLILSQGESFQHIWIVLRGRCQVVKQSRSGTEKELGTLEPFGVFGEMSFFHPAPHSASVRALTEVEVVRMPRDKYDTLLRAGSLAA